ncbi:uncharacterized protein LOC125042566 [Penaeus chinensis]|uniref:uncharacterized protein LOC125042566 n=1 Tax=Penaeus chinensis TaxID=139456 RepID=UPI001FB8481C|nr:uncharacterized protein LOC125042566 [Penaeus chinensis]
MKILSLQNISKAFISHMLKNVERCSDVSAAYKYLLPVAPHLAEIAYMCQYYKSPKLTELFLPILVAKGKLFINAINIKEILSYWNESECKTNVASITHLKVGDIEGRQYFNFLPFLGHLTRLQYLEIGSFVDDDLLVVLGINCPQLLVIDAREDTANAVTDVGLSYLALCTKLRRVLFSVFADEYDCTVDQLGFSGKGIALLLLSLPDLEHVQCSEYLLRDALRFIYQSSYHNRTLPVRCMFIDHPEVNVRTLQIVPILCPKLEVISLLAENNNEKLIGKSLRALSKLKILVLSLGSGCKFDLLNFASYGPQLVYLQVTTHLLDSQDVLLLSHTCVQLKTLVLKMFSFGFDGVGATNLENSLFPRVEKLELHQNISVRLFKFLNSNMENLREVYFTWATIHDLEDALTVVAQSGGWKNVELLVLPILSQISLPVAQMIAAALPNLKCLGITVHESEENDLNNYIHRYLPLVSRADQESVPSPSTSGIFSQNSWSDEIQIDQIYL